ncbi:MAG: AAA family ATPase [Candidatus Firestonebacteria bacterium]|nr:AAA family ATPase [Candidatus Firestonebacteria bacterium]
MYKEYWHLKENPFENVIDFRFLYTSPSFEECRSRLYYAVSQRKTGAVLIGTCGIGKSMVREALIKDLRKEGKYRVFSIVYPTLNIGQIVSECFYQLGETVESTRDKPLLLHDFGNKLLAINEKGEHAVLIIDDAQLLDLNTLGELKLFCNMHDYNERQLLSIILVGESLLHTKLINMPSLAQRLRLMAKLEPLDQELTGKYIAHRLKVAGGSENIFLPEAVEEIHKSSQGCLREINSLCDIALMIGVNETVPRINADIIKRIVSDVGNKAGEIDIC